MHDLEERGKVCACGAALSRIGQETSEQLDVIPAKVQVIRHLRYKYACKIRFYVWDSFINPLERVMGEFWRRIRLVGNFINGKSVSMLMDP